MASQESASLEPIRPPRHRARKRRCPCGRKAVFRTNKAKKYRYDRRHGLCHSCYLRLRDRLYAERIRENDDN